MVRDLVLGSERQKQYRAVVNGAAVNELASIDNAAIKVDAVLLEPLDELVEAKGVTSIAADLPLGLGGKLANKQMW